MKAIETRYNGYRFRSRLEARWAVFFDALGIEYQYEQQGYEARLNDEDVFRWLPDFYLPTMGCHVEVKGGKFSQQDSDKMGYVLDYGSPVPYMRNSDEYIDWERRQQLKKEGVTNPCLGVLLLGDIPYVEHGIIAHPIIRHYKGLRRQWLVFQGSQAEVISMEAAEILQMFDGSRHKWATGDLMDGAAAEVDFFDTSPMVAESKLARPKVCKAYYDARSARFEHGERGAAA